MVRIAAVGDAAQLAALNDEFNGDNNTTIENIVKSITNNMQEVVIVDEENGVLVGFVCVQLKKSFCYRELTPEITEVYVNPAHRKQGIASEMITFAEDYCTGNYPLHQFELLTGKDNAIAQSVYGKLGYIEDEELHLVKRIEK